MSSGTKTGTDFIRMIIISDLEESKTTDDADSKYCKFENFFTGIYCLYSCKAKKRLGELLASLKC